MYCPKCGNKIRKGNISCSTCGINIRKNSQFVERQEEISTEIPYGGYLAVGGWLVIIVGLIIVIKIFTDTKSSFGKVYDEVILTGIFILIAVFVYSWLYFGLHKVIMKLNRIEKALGITDSNKDYEEKDKIVESSSSENEKEIKLDPNDPDLPWELR